MVTVLYIVLHLYSTKYDTNINIKLTCTIYLKNRFESTYDKIYKHQRKRIDLKNRMRKLPVEGKRVAKMSL